MIVKSLKLTVFNILEGFGHYITFQGPDGVLNRGLTSLLKNFIMKHTYGQCFLIKKMFSLIDQFDARKKSKLFAIQYWVTAVTPLRVTIELSRRAHDI